MFRKETVILDGAMGTMLQKAGLRLGERPETLCITAPQAVLDIHRAYIAAGAQIILTNTFCANAHKLAGTGYSVDKVVRAAVRLAREACQGTKTKVALDIGPIGELLEPLGTLSFNDAYALFREMIVAGAQAGADLIFFETFSDLGEIRAGVLAAMENAQLPVFASMTFEASGRTFLGCSADAAAMTLSGLGIGAVGMNCSLGPVEAERILKKMRTATDLPLILKPNAGLPDPLTGEYTMPPQEFAAACDRLLSLGAVYIGGCCGTTPEYITALSALSAAKEARWPQKSLHGICSAGRVCAFGGIHVVGERINPTGKKRLSQALRDGDMRYIASQAIEQQDAGAQILDVNVGLAGIDEAQTMKKAVLEISAVSDLPLQIDSSDPAALEAGLRAAPGKCLINSVNATSASLDAVLPLAKKYGAAIVGLTIGENGLPIDDAQRVELAGKIIETAQEYGIPREDIAIDCLTLTVSAQQDQAMMTLGALSEVRRRYGVETMLGVSNISFGLPERDQVTRAFLTQAIFAGLTLPIVNPNNQEIMDAIAACRVLSGEDRSAGAYIQRFSGVLKRTESGKHAENSLTLEQAVMKGMKTEAAALARAELSSLAPLDVVNQCLMPALDAVGAAYERQELYLPQLMNATEAAGEAFAVIREALLHAGESGSEKGPVLLATVEGDIHDIGKNIVRTVLENYGYRVIDLGRDVKVERVVDAALRLKPKLIGLSALMTTTVPSMQRTIEALHAAGVNAPVVVGGAVLTQEYADSIGADYYAKDAKRCADIARMVIG